MRPQVIQLVDIKSAHTREAQMFFLSDRTVRKLKNQYVRHLYAFATLC